MSHLKILDRVALAAMLLAATAIPMAADALSFAPEPPNATVPLAKGGQRQFFTSGPLGTTTYRVDLDASGRVLTREQVLTEGIFQRIRAGMKAREVLEWIGPPNGKMRFDNLRLTAWDYHYRDGWGYIADLSVMVDDAGIVAGKSSVREGD